MKRGITSSEIFSTGFHDIFYSQAISLIGGMIAGIVLALYTDKLLLIPGMLILLPGFLEMRGSISGSFASRISSGLFVGVIRPQTHHLTKLFKGNIAASFVLAILVSLLLGIIAFIFNYFTLRVVTLQLIYIPLIAGVIANAIEIPLTLFFTLYFFRKGHDPNNIIGPFITSMVDISSIIALLVAMVIV